MKQRRTYRYTLVFVLYSIVAAPGTAQLSDGDFPGLANYLPNAERLYAIAGREDVMYEAAVSQHVPLINTLGAQTTINEDGLGDTALHIRPTVTLTAAFTVRQFLSPSGPVLTPSYRPSVAADLHFLHRVYYDSPMGGDADSNPGFGDGDPILFVTPRALLTHYSNGSEEPFIVGSSFNSRTGDYSSTFFTFGIAFLWWQPLRPGISEEGEPITGWHFRLYGSRDIHQSWGIPGEISSSLREYYNPEKWSFWAEWFVNDEVVPFSLEIGFDHYDAQPQNALVSVERFRFHAGLVFRPDWVLDQLGLDDLIASDLALYLRYDLGQDYYNIRFVNENNLFTLGLRMLPRVMRFNT